MNVKHFFSGLIVFSTFISTTVVGQEKETYPDKPVKIIVPYGAGGAADILARILADKLGRIWGQSVYIENKPGGIGSIGIMAAIKAPADGYTLISVPVSDLAVNPHLYKSRPFNIINDLSPISQIGAVPNVLVAANSLRVNSVKDLIAYAKKNPDGLTYSSPGVGSQAHIAAEMFGEKAGIKLTHIPYNSISSALVDVAGNNVDIMIAQLPAVTPLAQSGKITSLALIADKRSPLAPDLQTLEETSGISIGDAISWSGLLAPKDISSALAKKIAFSVTQAISSDEVKVKLKKQGTVGIGGTPEELRAAIQKDSVRYGAVIKKMNIQLE